MCPPWLGCCEKIHCSNWVSIFADILRAVSRSKVFYSEVNLWRFGSLCWYQTLKPCCFIFFWKTLLFWCSFKKNTRNISWKVMATPPKNSRCPGVHVDMAQHSEVRCHWTPVEAFGSRCTRWGFAKPGGAVEGLGGRGNQKNFMLKSFLVYKHVLGRP